VPPTEYLIPCKSNIPSESLVIIEKQRIGLWACQLMGLVMYTVLVYFYFSKDTRLFYFF